VSGPLISATPRFAAPRLYFVGKIGNLSAGNARGAEELLVKGPYVVEVGFQERTKDGKLRFPKFVRFRPDKPIRSSMFEEEHWTNSLQTSS